MLVDGNPLIHLVNRDKRQNIKIPLQNFSKKSLGREAYIFNSIDFNDVGNPVEPGLVYNLSVQKFLSHSILEISGKKLSIREVIKLVANNLGGVHFEEGGWRKVVNFDPHIPSNSYALRSAILAIAKSVSSGTQGLSKLCSPFPDYSRFLGHYDVNPGVVDFDDSQCMNVKYRRVDSFTSIAILSVMELKPQPHDESVFFLMQGSGNDFIKIFFTPLGDMCLEVTWGEIGFGQFLRTITR
jgi:hypothetical protein|tara:strand:- start:2383 stop:3102 length:720 start_codon:yes stop_codon:yes gene_type:complete